MANEMVRHGIRVYAYPGMTHVKAAIYDGWACLGSANLEKMSLRVSQELDVAFSDPTAVNRLKQDLFETDFARARDQGAGAGQLDGFICQRPSPTSMTPPFWRKKNEKDGIDRPGLLNNLKLKV